MAEHDKDHDPTEQPLVSHLLELRSRLMRSLVAILVIFLCLSPFMQEIYVIFSEPLLQALPAEGQTIATNPTAPFFVPFKLVLTLSLFLAMPYILFQAWAFIAPGLYKNEIRLAFPILISSIILFYVGIAFAYFVVLEFVLGFFAASSPETVVMMTDIGSYMSFALGMFLAFGFVFEIPVATVLIIAAGVTTPKALAEKRPYIVVGCFIVAVPLTPPDPLSLFMMAVPMLLLFELGVLAGRILFKDRVAETEAEAGEPAEKDAASK